MRSLWVWIVCVVLCLVIGALGSVITASEIPNWYAALNKPVWTPPNAAFPIVWTILYVMIGTALWALLRTPPSPQRAAALGWFALQLALNASWTPVFFGLHAPWPGLVVIIALLLAIAMTIWRARKVSPRAAWLLAPYAIWVAYAASLNAGIAWLN